MPQTYCEVLAIRHGLTDYNAQRRLQGQLDVPLNDVGRAQCRDCGYRLKQMLQRNSQEIAVDAIYASPLQRTKESAEIIREVAGIDCEIVLDERIQEWNAGVLQGHLLDELSTKFPKEWSAWNRSRDPNFVFPEGESFQHRYDRVKSFVLEMVARHVGQRVLVVTHGGVLDDLFRLVRKIPMKIKTNAPKGNAEIHILRAHPTRGDVNAKVASDGTGEPSDSCLRMEDACEVEWEIMALIFAALLPSAMGYPHEFLEQRRPKTGRHLTASNHRNREVESRRVVAPSFKQKAPKEGQMRECGEGHKGLLTMSIDNADPDAKVLVHAQMTKAKFTAFTGAAVEKEYTLKDILIPIETIDDRCFLVRNKADFGTVFCARSLHRRNEWINYLHEGILCEETGFKGKLPAEPGEEMEKEEAVLQTMPVEEPSGINIHLSDSPLGKPQVLVNGNGRPPKAIAAMHEAAAEQRLVDLGDPRVPETGYAKMSMKSAGNANTETHKLSENQQLHDTSQTASNKAQMREVLAEESSRQKKKGFAARSHRNDMVLTILRPLPTADTFVLLVSSWRRTSERKTKRPPRN
ncbi:hypothetical protein Esti_001376 [Eimeria stiedai]